VHRARALLSRGQAQHGGEPALVAAERTPLVARVARGLPQARLQRLEASLLARVGQLVAAGQRAQRAVLEDVVEQPTPVLDPVGPDERERVQLVTVSRPRHRPVGVGRLVHELSLTHPHHRMRPQRLSLDPPLVDERTVATDEIDEHVVPRGIERHVGMLAGDRLVQDLEVAGAPTADAQAIGEQVHGSAQRPIEHAELPVGPVDFGLGEGGGT
jgi:hypothetical protein